MCYKVAKSHLVQKTLSTLLNLILTNTISSSFKIKKLGPVICCWVLWVAKPWYLGSDLWDWIQKSPKKLLVQYSYHSNQYRQMKWKWSSSTRKIPCCSSQEPQHTWLEYIGLFCSKSFNKKTAFSTQPWSKTPLYSKRGGCQSSLLPGIPSLWRAICDLSSSRWHSYLTWLVP